MDRMKDIIRAIDFWCPTGGGAATEEPQEWHTPTTAYFIENILPHLVQEVGKWFHRENLWDQLPDVVIEFYSEFDYQHSEISYEMLVALDVLNVAVLALSWASHLYHTR